MAMLQLIIRNNSRRISCIKIAYLLDIFDTEPDQPKTENFVTQSDPTRLMDRPDPRPNLS